MIRIPVLVSTLLAFALGMLSAPAQAWSALGHRLIGEIAQRHLTPAANAEVARLLAGESDPSLGGVASWADTLRSSDPDAFKRTSRWHYVNLDSHDCHYDPPRDCPDGQCVVAAIAAQQAILADPTQPLAARRDALKFLVHFIGDVHQPLHAGDHHDKGGNDYQISLATPIQPEAYARDRYVNGVQGTNLHAVWDFYILGSRGLDAEAYAVLLDRAPWSAPRVAFGPAFAAPWAEQSCGLVERAHLYPPGHKLDARYLDGMRPLAEQQVHRAAERLAAVLNETLDPAHAAAP